MINSRSSVAPLLPPPGKVMVAGRMGAEGQFHHCPNYLGGQPDVLPAAGEFLPRDHLFHGDDGPFPSSQGAVNIPYQGHVQDGIPVGIRQPAVHQAQIRVQRLHQGRGPAAEGIPYFGIAGEIFRQGAAPQGPGGEERKARAPAMSLWVRVSMLHSSK